MALAQLEFVLLISVLAGYLIFTPEPLLMLRNLAAWAIVTWLAWSCYEIWQNNKLLRQFISDLDMGRGFGDMIGNLCRSLLVSHLGWCATTAFHIQEACMRVFRKVAGWKDDNTPATEDRPKQSTSGYRVILVTTRPIHRFGLISDNLFTVPEPASDIRWNSTSIPSDTPTLTFRRHFALCLMPQNIWECKDKSLKRKFEGQRFWDYCDSYADSCRASLWDRSRIRGITAMQDLGPASCASTAPEVCSRLYDQLVIRWGDYFPIWWNSSDFAIVLALLLVGNAAAERCRHLMDYMAHLREVEILRPRAASTWLSGFQTMAACAGTIALTAATGGVAAPFIAAAAAGSLGSLASSRILSDAEKGRLKKRVEACSRLVLKFPALEPLFEN